MVDASVIVFVVILVLVVIGVVVITLITFGFVPSNNLSCPAGECVVNQNNGSKICPSGDESLQYNNLSQFCSQPTSCSNPTYPFAIQPDGSTNNQGQCALNPTTGEPSICRCVNSARCPIYTATAFTVSSGSTVDASSATASLVQTVNPFLNGQTGDTSPDTSQGMVIDDPEQTFCQVPLSWLFATSPGCVVTSDSPQDNIRNCFAANPCVQGILAAISDDPLIVLGADVNALTVGCVTAPYLDPDTQSCPANTIPILTPGTGKVICSSFP